MIQFNLLPDVKVQHIKTERTKRMVMLGSFALTGVSVLILVLMFSYSMAQKHHLSALNKDIKDIRTKLEGNKDLTRMLSVQNQLNSLPALYAGRPAADRLPAYIEQTTPNDVSISKLSIDFSTSSMQISGMATSLSAINKYVDTLKFTKFNVEDDPNNQKNAFKDVVLSQQSIGSKNTNATDGLNASYSIVFNFEPQIFDNAKPINLNIPAMTTTHAQGSAGVQLFSTSPVKDSDGGQP